MVCVGSIERILDHAEEWFGLGRDCNAKLSQALRNQRLDTVLNDLSNSGNNLLEICSIEIKWEHYIRKHIRKSVGSSASAPDE